MRPRMDFQNEKMRHMEQNIADVFADTRLFLGALNPVFLIGPI